MKTRDASRACGSLIRDPYIGRKLDPDSNIQQWHPNSIPKSIPCWAARHERWNIPARSVFRHPAPQDRATPQRPTETNSVDYYHILYYFKTIYLYIILSV